MATKRTRLGGYAITRLLAAGFAMGFTSAAIAVEPPTMAEMMNEADKWMMSAVSRFSAEPVGLPAYLTSAPAASAMARIYSRNWPAVKAYADARLEALPWVAPTTSAQSLATLSLQDEAPPVFALLLQREGGLLTLRFFDPESFAIAAYGMVTGARMPSADVLHNGAGAGYLSKRIFRTELSGAPAIGMSQGLWTAIATYARSEHGLFAPATIVLFDRSKED